MSTNPAEARLHFEGGPVRGHSVDVETICDTLRGLQKSLRMLASVEVEGWDGTRQKYRPSDRIVRQVTLRLSAAEPGSVVFPLELAPRPTGLIADEQVVLSPLWDTLEAVFEWIGQDAKGTPPIVGPALEHVLRSFQDWLPNDDGLTLSLLRGRPTIRSFNKQVRQDVDKILEARTFEDLLLKGEIIQTKPPEGTVKLRFPHLGRTMWVTLPPELRHVGIPQTGGQWLELEGRFRCSAWGEPLEPVDIVVRRPDLGPVELEWLTLRPGEEPLALSPPLRLPVELDQDTHQLYVVRDEQLGIHVFAYARQDVEAELVEQLRFLWTEFALAEEAALAPSAQEVARNLRARVSRRAS